MVRQHLTDSIKSGFNSVQQGSKVLEGWSMGTKRETQISERHTPSGATKCIGQVCSFLIVNIDGYQERFVKVYMKPDESENDLKIPFKLKRILASAGTIKSVSSAYYTIGKSPPKDSLMGCLRTPRCQALLMMDYKSAPRAKRRGERGSLV